MAAQKFAPQVAASSRVSSVSAGSAGTIPYCARKAMASSASAEPPTATYSGMGEFAQRQRAVGANAPSSAVIRPPSKALRMAS